MLTETSREKIVELFKKIKETEQLIDYHEKRLANLRNEQGRLYSEIDDIADAYKDNTFERIDFEIFDNGVVVVLTDQRDPKARECEFLKFPPF